MISVPISMRRFPPCSVLAINYVTWNASTGSWSVHKGVAFTGTATTPPTHTLSSITTDAMAAIANGPRKASSQEMSVCLLTGRERGPDTSCVRTSAHTIPSPVANRRTEGRHRAPLSRARVQSVLLRSSAHFSFKPSTPQVF